MKIYVDKKPETCGVCTLVNVNVLDVMENREMVLQHLCPILDLSVNPDNLDANCQLTELKPKKLVWECHDEKWYSVMFEGCEISFSQSLSNTFIIGVNDICIQEHTNKTNEELKEICQNYYNEIFFEMLGVKK